MTVPEGLILCTLVIVAINAVASDPIAWVHVVFSFLWLGMVTDEGLKVSHRWIARLILWVVRDLPVRFWHLAPHDNTLTDERRFVTFWCTSVPLGMTIIWFFGLLQLLPLIYPSSMCVVPAAISTYLLITSYRHVYEHSRCPHPNILRFLEAQALIEYEKTTRRILASVARKIEV